MSTVTATRDSIKNRLSKQRSVAVSKDTTAIRNQPTTRSPATPATKPKPKIKWSSSTSLGADSASTSLHVASSTSLSDSSSLMENKHPARTRKAPLPVAARQSTIKRNMCRRTNAAPKEPPPRQVRDDGWDADTEDAEPVVIKKDVKRSTFDKGFSRKKVAEARKVLQECGVLSNQSTAAHFAALSDADYSLSPPSVTRGPHQSPKATPKEPSMGELRESISMLQKQVADLRSDVPQVSTNPLREQVDLNRRAMEGHSNSLGLPRAQPGASSFSVGGASAMSQASSTLPAADAASGALGQPKKAKKRTDGRSRKVPLPAELMTGYGGPASSSLAAGQSANVHLSKAFKEEDGEDSDASASSFGLSCGLPGLSHEVADTITHLSAAETIQASVTVTPLSLRDWLFRPVPTPMDPSLTLYGAAVHNAHVACCEVCIGGLLSAIEDGAMERPAGLPCGTYDFRSRGMSDEEGLQSVLRALAEWMKSLVNDTESKRALAPTEASTGVPGQDGDVSGGSILQDPRVVPLLGVLRSEALRIIGEEDYEQSTVKKSHCAAHLNSTDMLHILTTALVPSFRQLVSRSGDTAAMMDTQQGLEADAQLGTSKSSSSLFSVSDNLEEKASDLPDQPESESAQHEAQVAACAAVPGVRPDNPCDSSDPEPAVIDDSPVLEVTAVTEETVDEQPKKPQPGMGMSPLAAMTMMDMKKAKDSMPGDHCDEVLGPGVSTYGESSMSMSLDRTGSISADALTDALRKLVIAGGEDGSSGVEEVDVVEMLRQLAAERVAARKPQPEVNDGSANSSPAHDTTSDYTAPSSVSSQPRSGANSENGATSVKNKDSRREHNGDKETELLQAAELEKMLQHPQVMQMLTQLAQGGQGAAIPPEQLHMQQQQAAMHVAKERERAERYERQIAAQQQQQRMMMNTFVNMNMVQNQMANAMFSSMMHQPQQQKGPGIEKFAMLRSMAKRHGVKELSGMPLKHGASVMMGQTMMPGMGGSMMPPGVPGMMGSMMPPAMPPQPRMQTPINRFASSISMPYLQVGGQTPLPQNQTAPEPPANNLNVSAASASGSEPPSVPTSATRSTTPKVPSVAVSQVSMSHDSLPNVPSTVVSQASVSHESLPSVPSALKSQVSLTLSHESLSPAPSGGIPPAPAILGATSASGSGHGSVSVNGTAAMNGQPHAPRSSTSGHGNGHSHGYHKQSPGKPQHHSQGQSRSHHHRKSSHQGMYGHPMQSQSMTGGMMPQQGHMGMHRHSSGSYMGGMGGSMIWNGSMMGGPMMGGMGQPGMHGMMPQQAAYMGGMQTGSMGSNSFMQNSAYMNGMQQRSMGSHMGMPQGSGSMMGGSQMGGMMNPYAGMPVPRSSSSVMSEGHSNKLQRSSSLPHGQGSSSRRGGQHCHSGAGHHHSSSSGHHSSSQHRPRTSSHSSSAGYPQAQPRSQGSVQRTPPQQQSPYYSGVPQPASYQDTTRSHGTADCKIRSSTWNSQQSSSNAGHDAKHSSCTGSSKDRSQANSLSRSPGDKMHHAMPNISPGYVAHTPDNKLAPPPMHGELASSTDGSGSFLFDSAGSQQLAAAAAAVSTSTRNSSAPAAPGPSQPQRQYKHLGSRTGRKQLSHLDSTPEGEDESTNAGDSQILL